jgi:hypothetical protein
VLNQLLPQYFALDFPPGGIQNGRAPKYEPFLACNFTELASASHADCFRHCGLDELAAMPDGKEAMGDCGKTIRDGKEAMGPLRSKRRRPGTNSVSNFSSAELRFTTR